MKDKVVSVSMETRIVELRLKDWPRPRLDNALTI